MCGSERESNEMQGKNGQYDREAESVEANEEWNLSGG